jgi:cytochrome c-type biogenesis protein CcmF
MWGGVVIMVCAGCLSLTDRRHRIGAPAKSRAQGPVTAQMAGA